MVDGCGLRRWSTDGVGEVVERVDLEALGAGDLLGQAGVHDVQLAPLSASREAGVGGLLRERVVTEDECLKPSVR